MQRRVLSVKDCAVDKALVCFWCIDHKAQKQKEKFANQDQVLWECSWNAVWNSLHLSLVKQGFASSRRWSNSVLPEFNLFISSVFVVFFLEMNFECSLLFQQLKHATFRDMNGKCLLSLKLGWWKRANNYLSCYKIYHSVLAYKTPIMQVCYLCFL